MSPAEVRWRCERMEHLLTFCSRMESVMQVNAEAHNKPWLGDPRPAPLPLQMGASTMARLMPMTTTQVL